MAQGDFLIGAVGDVFLDREDPSTALDPVAPILRGLDLVLGNCEGAYTDRPQFAPSARWRCVSGVHNAAPLGPAGFDVLTGANNHTLDGGHVGLSDTVAALKACGVLTAGVGESLAEARMPLLVSCQGSKIAIVARASVFQPGYEARPGVPGLAPVRIHSHYYIPDWDAYGGIEPGVRPHVRTFPYPEDLAALQADIVSATKSADLVIASFHWGEASKRAFLTDYELQVGHAAIDAGADAVLGHHHHFLRGIAWYKGRPIFYGLGHFVFDLRWIGDKLDDATIDHLKHTYGDYAIYPRVGYPLLPFHEDGRLTLIALLEVRRGQITGAGFIPCIINPQNQAVPVDPESTQGRRVVDYMREISDEVSLGTRYVLDGWAVGEHRVVRALPSQ